MENSGYKGRAVELAFCENVCNSERMEIVRLKAPSSEYDALARSARRAQATYLNILNTPTKLDVYVSTKMQELLHRLPKRFWDNKYVDGLMNSNPVGWANVIVYRTYLGFFNLKQFVLQGPLQMLNTLAIAPVKGTQALISMPAVILGHFFKDTPIVKYIPKLFQPYEQHYLIPLTLK